MLEVGQRLPSVRVQRGPGEEVSLAALAAAGPILLLFYLFDWSST